VDLGRDALRRERPVLFGRTHVVPDGLAEALRRELGLDGSQRLLDVGCGPGSLTLLLAPFVATAVGIDADCEMVREAARGSSRSGQSNVSWRHMRAEELPADLGEFELVTFAQSFHWMDRPAVAVKVRMMLTPGGVCAYVHATTHRGDDSTDPLAHPRPPYEKIGELVSEYLGPVRRAGRGSLPEGPPAGEEEVLREAGFTGPHHLEVSGGAVLTRTSEEIVAATFSLSSSPPELFGSCRESFGRDLLEVLDRASP
jgi:SAM-dependent methyltransferase